MHTLTHASAQGDRTEQQDRYVIAEMEGPPAGTLLAVMDGHGGPRTAEISANHLAALFQLGLKAHASDPLRTLTEAVRRLAQRTEIETSGSTLSAVFLPKDADVAHAAVLGDSPVLVLDNKAELWTGPLHNVRTNLPEREAAVSRGGLYAGGYLEDPRSPGSALQMSRALGDRGLSRVLNRDPEVFSIPLGKNSWVLLATDGVLEGWNTDLNEQLRKLASDVQKGSDAQALVDDAVRRRTGDNVSLLLWRC